ncbi:hypothetical protein N7510_003623 [Penicillium lagena]|uniref:uncharacterized protein n=1 Tax=Penicillium lagena TaxID=94218 RepID=UPI0025409130|nr:uncharacterized protein N7510_003623 [Penicillium lagena]KAJ5619639.1 hypothetical protein N7510_003623 [Penicillium lagena]
MDHLGSRGLRPIAPRTVMPGLTPPGQGPPGPLPPEEPRMKRASTACTECKRRRTRCADGKPGKPCSECETHGRQCFFDEGSDKRRKISAKRTQEDLRYYRQFVDFLLEAIRTSEYSVVQHLIEIIRAGMPEDQLAAEVAHILNRTPLPLPTDRRNTSEPDTNPDSEMDPGMGNQDPMHNLFGYR